MIKKVSRTVTEIVTQNVLDFFSYLHYENTRTDNICLNESIKSFNSFPNRIL